MDEIKRLQLERLSNLRMHRQTIEECAQALGVSRSTIKRMLASDDYSQVVREQREHWLDSSKGLILEATKTAVETLLEVCKHPRAGFQAKVLAAKALGDWGLNQDEEDMQQDDRVELHKLQLQILRRQQELAARPAEQHLHLHLPAGEQLPVLEGVKVPVQEVLPASQDEEGLGLQA